MADKKAYMKPEEPYHLKMLRNIQEEKDKKEAESSFWAAKVLNDKKKKENSNTNSEYSEEDELMAAYTKNSQKQKSINGGIQSVPHRSKNNSKLEPMSDNPVEIKKSARPVTQGNEG